MRGSLEWGGYKNREALALDLFAGSAESVIVEEREGVRKGSLQVWRRSERLFECEFHLEADEEGKGAFWGVHNVPMKEEEVRELFLDLERGVSLRNLFAKRNVKQIGGHFYFWKRILLYLIAGLLVSALFRWVF